MPSEYERAAMEARRRQRMAEMLAQQAYDPSTVQGAPIPSAAPLVQGLQAFLTARQQRKAEEALEKAEAADVEGYRKLREELGPRSQIAAPTNTQIAESVGMPQIAEDGTVSYGQTAMPKLGMEQVMPTAQERERALEDAFLAGSPRAQKYAEFLMAKEPQSKLMEFGDQLLNVQGGVATPVTMGGKPLQAAPRAAEGTTLARLIAERDNLPPNSPLRATYDAAISKETTRPVAPVTNVYSTTAVAGVDEQGNPIFFQPSKSGGQPSIIEGVRPAPKGMNESQAKAAGFADRLVEANPVLETGPVGLEAGFLAGLPGGVGNLALTDQQQVFLQAERNFINSVLRRESGAVISEEEFKNARQQYIPQPGDSPAVLEQKRKNRNTVLNSLQRDAGPQYKPPVSITGSGFSQSGWGEAQVVR
jgi:hypothetical protein